MEEQEKPKGGRPPVPFDWSVFEGLCHIQCTLPEIAAVMGVSEDTIERRCKAERKRSFAEVFAALSATAKASVRRTQYTLAVGSEARYDEKGCLIHAERKPSERMNIWWGINHLGQSNRQELVGAGGKPLIPSSDPFDTLAKLLNELDIKVSRNGSNGRRTPSDDDPPTGGTIDGRTSDDQVAG
jgi:hypothetical protein